MQSVSIQGSSSHRSILRLMPPERVRIRIIGEVGIPAAIWRLAQATIHRRQVRVSQNLKGSSGKPLKKPPGRLTTNMRLWSSRMNIKIATPSPQIRIPLTHYLGLPHLDLQKGNLSCHHLARVILSSKTRFCLPIIRRQTFKLQQEILLVSLMVVSRRGKKEKNNLCEGTGRGNLLGDALVSVLRIESMYSVTRFVYIFA